MRHIYFKPIINEIPTNAKVLDLGCGDGTLLAQLIAKKKVNAYGIDIDFNNIIACIDKHISVYQSNIDKGLPEFTDQSFDYVIFSQTLQEIRNPILVISEILRVGKKGIITFPNFAHWRSRLQVLFGNTPKTRLLPYDWFESPNIRFLTINDFQRLCELHNVRIIKQTAVYKTPFINKLIPFKWANLLAEKAMFVIERS